jgi:hypothetical protein
VGCATMQLQATRGRPGCDAASWAFDELEQKSIRDFYFYFSDFSQMCIIAILSVTYDSSTSTRSALPSTSVRLPRRMRSHRIAGRRAPRRCRKMCTRGSGRIHLGIVRCKGL